MLSACFWALSLELESCGTALQPNWVWQASTKRPAGNGRAPQTGRKPLFRGRGRWAKSRANIPDLLPEFGRLLPYGYGMQICHSEKSNSSCIPDPVAQGAEIVAQRWTRTAEYSLSARFWGSGVSMTRFLLSFKCNRKPPVPCLDRSRFLRYHCRGSSRLDGRASPRQPRGVG